MQIIGNAHLFGSLSLILALVCRSAVYMNNTKIAIAEERQPSPEFVSINQSLLSSYRHLFSLLDSSHNAFLLFFILNLIFSLSLALRSAFTAEAIKTHRTKRTKNECFCVDSLLR